MDDDHSTLDAALKKIAILVKVHPKLDAALNKIANLAEVPDACGGPGVRTKRDSFRSLMLVGLREGRQLHLSKAKIRLFPTLNAVDDHLKDIALAAGNLANLLGPADEAHSHALEQLQLQLLASERGGNSLGPIAQILSELHHDKPLVAIAEILGELENAISITRSSLQKTNDDPATSVGYKATTNIKENHGARCVIRWLLDSSNKMGKGLAFSRIDSDVEGPLIKAISILKEADNFFTWLFPGKASHDLRGCAKRAEPQIVYSCVHRFKTLDNSNRWLFIPIRTGILGAPRMLSHGAAQCRITTPAPMKGRWPII